MAQKIKNIPSPDILMNSLRSIGYSFKTALADRERIITTKNHLESFSFDEITQIVVAILNNLIFRRNVFK